MNQETDNKKTGCSSGCIWLLIILLLLIGAAAFAWWKGYIPQSYLPSFLQSKPTDSADAGAGGGKGGPGGGAGGGAGGKNGGGKRGGGPVPVVVAQARKGDLPIYLPALGTVTALNTITIHTRVDGELMQIGYTEGEHIKKGALIAQIDPRPFQAQLDQAQGQLAKDKASLTFSKSDLDRYQNAKEAVTQQNIDNAKAQVGQFEGAVKTDEANVETAQLQLTYAHITSPIDGRVGLRLVDTGNIVHAADAGGIVVITQVSPITVIFSLSENFLPQILKAHLNGKDVPVDAYDSANKDKLETGKLLAVDSSIDATTGTIRCRAIFDNKDEIMFPQQFVNARLLVDTRKDVVLIPLAALQHSPETPDFVYVVKDDSTVELRPIKSGTSESEQLIVESGLNPGETVVTEGVDKLQPGAKVTMPEAKEGGAPGAGKHGGQKSSPGGPAATPDQKQRDHKQKTENSPPAT